MTSSDVVICAGGTAFLWTSSENQDNGTIIAGHRPVVFKNMVAAAARSGQEL